jgi:DNA-binding response OmpR family regulator
LADVILVEDNVALRKSLADCLTVLGHRVTEAGDAVELYQLIGQQVFDVAVVDVNLPHHSGFSITEYLSGQTRTAVIITTVRDAVEDRVRAYQSGADIYMAKPVEPEELSAAIQHLAGRRRAGDEGGGAQGEQGWVFQTQSMMLTAPNGEAVRLSRREALFVEHMVRSESDVVGRQEIFAALGEPDNETSRSRLDVLLSRLRSKVLSGTKASLPVITAHNTGFSLSAPFHLR